ncbi:ubiquinone biosynthesis monooxygenase COQ6, mitochondrial-like isoform X2 [Stegodyphus dumicola]|uniref:ubiquinone biosynthesis monooxygenase COQ6, mitochondrial-like isoform X2 n=1 Tax=Stegodyphus dumicola TaxID=202533 RepID=UPI0015AA33ED|nr:ubiquinone biosynthesis monooxygenase COQ6, mitochondrial-like isoform X2 [Stegodyphus dumicola]
MKEVKKLTVWESCSDARIAFQHEGMQDNVAYIVENNAILNALYSVVKESGNRIEVMKGAKAADYSLPTEQDDLVTVTLGNDTVLRTKLLPTENIVAWQRFLTTGPVALLPLSDDQCSLVWTVSLPMSEKLLEMPEEEFVDTLNSALWNEENKNSVVDSAVSTLKNMISSIFPGAESVRQLPPSILSVEPNSRAAFPLGLGHAAEYVAPRVALIGDSAHRVHPLAGQGVNLGFGDVECLTECLETSVYNGECVGNLDSLLDYEMKRQRHILSTMLAIDALHRLYKTEFTPIVLMRSLGVTALDVLHPIKKQIMHQASG